MAGYPDALFSTTILVQVVQNLKTAQTFLLDRFFPNVVEAETEFVAIDVDVGKRRMSPFVSPLVEGKLVEARSVQTNVFNPPYIKDKRAPDLLRPVRRQIGERIGGGLTPQERMEANLVFEMNDQIDMLKRRQEWMAAQALLTGTLTVSGDGFPTAVINFGRASALTLALTGAAMWDAAGSTASPATDFDDYATLVLKESGAPVTDLVFTPTPWKYFIQDQNVRDSLWYPRAGETNQINIGSQVVKGAQYKGHWGNYDLWLYNDWYVDDTNTEQRMLPDGTVLIGSGGSEGLSGTRAYGIIKDPAFNYGALAYAPKSWVKEDPAQRFLMMQSAPLVIPSRVNAFMALTCTQAKSV